MFKMLIIWWQLWQGNREFFEEKRASVPLCPPQILYGLLWHWTQTSVLNNGGGGNSYLEASFRYYVLRLWNASTIASHCRWDIFFFSFLERNTRSVRKVSDRIFLCENLMDYNLARLHEPTLNLSAHAWIFSRLSIASVAGKQHLSEVVCSARVVYMLQTTSGCKDSINNGTKTQQPRQETNPKGKLIHPLQHNNRNKEQTVFLTRQYCPLSYKIISSCELIW